MGTILVHNDASHGSLRPIRLAKGSSTGSAGGLRSLSHVTLTLMNDFKVMIDAQSTVSLENTHR